MKLAIKLVVRNLIGAGLRTWLNVIVLSFSYVIIIWMNGVMIGWEEQAKHDMTNWQIGGGQYWHQTYDPYDPFSITDSHASIPTEFESEVAKGDMEPILIVQGTIYPQGRMQSIAIKGINPKQTIFSQPTQKLDTVVDGLPAIMGAMMAKDLGINKGDYITVRWRDAN
ncbi:MAG: ABC transporter permease, partial [Bacteroidetes bacterium HGW-Bacteroidetes-15]